MKPNLEVPAQARENLTRAGRVVVLSPVATAYFLETNPMSTIQAEPFPLEFNPEKRTRG
jgi:hypothetical protein